MVQKVDVNLALREYNAGKAYERDSKGCLKSQLEEAYNQSVFDKAHAPKVKPAAKNPPPKHVPGKPVAKHAPPKHVPGKPVAKHVPPKPAAKTPTIDVLTGLPEKPIKPEKGIDVLTGLPEAAFKTGGSF